MCTLFRKVRMIWTWGRDDEEAVNPLDPKHTHEYISIPSHTIQSTEGESFDVALDTAKMSELVKTMIDEDQVRYTNYSHESHRKEDEYFFCA